VRNTSLLKLQRTTSGANRRPNPVQHAGDASNIVFDSIHRSVLENLRDGVISLDLDGRITTFLVSDRVLLGTGLVAQAPASGRSTCPMQPC
jgi:PAS domain-containing protein